MDVVRSGRLSAMETATDVGGEEAAHAISKPAQSGRATFPSASDQLKVHRGGPGDFARESEDGVAWLAGSLGEGPEELSV